MIFCIGYYLLCHTTLQATLVTKINPNDLFINIDNIIKTSDHCNTVDLSKLILSIQQIAEIYGTEIDWNECIEDAVTLIAQNNKLSQQDVDTARSFYYNLEQAVERLYSELSKTVNLASVKAHDQCLQAQQHIRNPVIELPNRLAVGLTCVLAGDLLCTLPGCEAYGTDLISLGKTFILEMTTKGS